MAGAASVAPLKSDAQVSNLLRAQNGLDNRDHFSFAGQYGLGTMMHELLHKQAVGGGFSHSQMSTALARIGLSPGDYALGHNAISDQIGRLCF
jgi:hypothetical protein